MDLSLRIDAYQSDSRGWLRSPHGTEPGTTPSIALDLTAAGGFVKATHYPNGYIRSGVVLGKITASGKYGLYDSGASDGRQTAVGILFNSESVRDGQPTAANAMLVHGFVETARLPFPAQVTTPVKTALNLINFS